MKIAIFGGSFNPVHNEHKNVVLAAIKSLGLDKVLVIPSNITPAKDGCFFAESKHRLEMCRLAFSDIEKVEVSDMEIASGGVSYSYITCEKLQKKYPRDELYFIVGGDMLENFPKWKNPERILKCVRLAVCARESGEKLQTAVENFEREFGEKPVIFDYIGGAVSSTAIRTLCALGEDISGLTDTKTAKYIKENSLYSIPEIQGVKKLLTEERWQHTVRVALTSAENCRRVCVDERSAITAAALHDCAKYLGFDSPYLKGFEKEKDVPPPVVHQYSGAFVAEHTFGVKDKQILNAIRYHTSGRENMSGAEKLLYLCDMLESGRNFDGVQHLRLLFEKDIDECLFAALSHQIKYLKKSGKEIYPLTLKAYNYLKENL